MKMLKVFAIFAAGVLTGAAALFFLLAHYGSDTSVHVEKKVISVVTKQESCLISAAEQARDIYNDLMVRRGNLGTEMESRLVSQNEMDKENMIKKELYARVGSLIEPCVVFGEPVKLNRNILADIRGFGSLLLRLIGKYGSFFDFVSKIGFHIYGDIF